MPVFLLSMCYSIFMTNFKIINFIVFFLAFGGILFIGSFSVYKTYTAFGNFPTIFNKILLILLIVMPVLFIGTTLISMKQYSQINSIFYTISSSWLPILAYLFLGSIILTILNVTISSTILFPVIYKYTVYGLLLLSFGLNVYGLINSNNFIIKTINIPKENELSGPLHGKKVVLFADTHIGVVHKKNFLNKVVKLINKQNPDIVLLAGDLIDGPKIPFNDFLSPIKDIKSNIGTFYTPGNHEIYYGDQEEIYKFTDQYTVGLRNKITQLEGFNIIGLTYDAKEGPDATLNRLYASQYDKNTPTIVILHEPKNNKTLQNEGVDLVVSGHTHGGQFWPFSLLVKGIYKEYTTGLVMVGNNASITTTGIGTWGPAARIGTNPEIVIINFE